MELVKLRKAYRKVFRRAEGKTTLRYYAAPVHCYVKDVGWEDIIPLPIQEVDGIRAQRTAYELFIPKGQIGFVYTSNETGGKVWTSLLRVDNKTPTVPTPRIDKQSVVWDYVAQGFSVLLKLRPTGVEWFKILHGPGHPDTVDWEIVYSPEIDPALMRTLSEGRDNKGRKFRVDSSYRKSNLRNGNQVAIFREVYTPNVSVMVDEVSRKRGWSPNVVWPVLIDVPDITENTGSNADDGVTITTETQFRQYGIYDGKLRVTEFYGNKVQTGVRIVAISADQGQQIDLAELFLYQLAGNSSITGTWYGDDVDNAAAWASSTSLPRNITKTTASAASVLGSNSSYVAQDITSIVQEILDRAGWANGNAMRFLCEVTSGTGQDNGLFWKTTGYTPSHPPYLEVTFSAGPYTGTIAQTLPSFTQAATGTAAKPVFTGVVTQTLGAFTQAAAGTHTPPVFTGTIDQTLPAFIQAAIGSTQTYTATIAQTLGAFTQSALIQRPAGPDAAMTWPTTWPVTHPSTDFDFIRRT